MKFYRIKSTISNDMYKQTKPDPQTGEYHPRVFPSLHPNNLKDKKLVKFFSERKISPTKLIPKSFTELDYFSYYYDTHENEEHWIQLDIYWAVANEFQFAYYGFVVSPAVKAVLEKFILGKECAFVPCKIEFRGGFLDYFFFQFVYNERDDFHLDHLRLVCRDDESKPYRKSILTKQDFFRFSSFTGRQSEWSNALGLLNYDTYSDIIGPSPFTFIVVSERLKTAIEDAQFTGVDFQEIDYLNFNFLNSPLS